VVRVHRDLSNESACFLSTLFHDAFQLHELISASLKELFQTSNGGTEKNRGTASPSVYPMISTRFEPCNCLLNRQEATELFGGLDQTCISS
jgi:hypothetical protein